MAPVDASPGEQLSCTTASNSIIPKQSTPHMSIAIDLPPCFLHGPLMESRVRASTLFLGGVADLLVHWTSYPGMIASDRFRLDRFEGDAIGSIFL